MVSGRLLAALEHLFPAKAECAQGAIAAVCFDLISTSTGSVPVGRKGGVSREQLFNCWFYLLASLPTEMQLLLPHSKRCGCREFCTKPS